MFETVIYEVKNNIGYITINRPKQLNALNYTVLGELSKAVDMAASDSEVKVVIVSGAGGKAFVAGADIAAMQYMTPTQAHEWALYAQEIFNRIQYMPKMVIAAIDGYALGGGCELALACDIRVASEKSMIGIPEVTLGVFPGFAGTQ